MFFTHKRELCAPPTFQPPPPPPVPREPEFPTGEGCVSWAKWGLELTASWFFGLAGPL